MKKTGRAEEGKSGRVEGKAEDWNDGMIEEQAPFQSSRLPIFRPSILPLFASTLPGRSL